MNKFWLKITGFAVLVIAVAAAAYVFWPTDSRDIEKAQQGERSGLQAPAGIAESGPPAGAEDEYYYEGKRIAVEYPGSAHPSQKEYVSRNRSPLDQGRYATRRPSPQHPTITAKDKEEAEKLMEMKQKWMDRLSGLNQEQLNYLAAGLQSKYPLLLRQFQNLLQAGQG